MADQTRPRFTAWATVAWAVAVSLGACQPTPSAAPSQAALASPSSEPSILPPTPLPPTPGPTTPTPVELSSRIPATIACEVPAGRTLKLTDLTGSIAYGYEAELTPWSERDSDRDNPQRVEMNLGTCDLGTGTFVRLAEIIDGVRREEFVTHLGLVAQDAERILFGGGEATWVLDKGTSHLERLAGFTDRRARAIGLDYPYVLGEQTLPALPGSPSEPDTVPAILDLRTGDVRILTAAELGVDAPWIRPQAISNGIIVGRTQDDGNDWPLWAFDLGTGRPIDVPSALRQGFITVRGFDGQVIVGSSFPHDSDDGPRPFAWRVGSDHVTWLKVGAGHMGASAIAVDGALVVGNVYGPNDQQGEFTLHVGMRAVVWDIASGERLDLGTGPAALSGTMATEAGLEPQSLAADIEGDRVLGFLGSGCDDTPPCNAYSFGGTPVIWDIGAWLTSIGR
ncbi:MAG TPA: hypothetical protein VJ850_00545 [Candidatus Limnocylindrales bacterium]|nr:hypothetical protein [Candidatus Limnocylindrales bacterium]